MRFIVLIILVLSLSSCFHAPNYEERITEIGTATIDLSQRFEKGVDYRDTIPDFAYGQPGQHGLLNALRNNNYNVNNSKVVVGVGTMDGMFYKGRNIDYNMSFVKGDTVIGVYLRYEDRDDIFHLISYQTLNP